MTQTNTNQISQSVSSNEQSNANYEFTANNNEYKFEMFNQNITTLVYYTLKFVYTPNALGNNFEVLLKNEDDVDLLFMADASLLKNELNSTTTLLLSPFRDAAALLSSVDGLTEPIVPSVSTRV